jgi:hypothetical protein
MSGKPLLRTSGFPLVISEKVEVGINSANKHKRYLQEIHLFGSVQKVDEKIFGNIQLYETM